MTLDHLIVPVDFSPCSELAVKYALKIAQRSGSLLTFLHVDIWGAPDDHGVEPPPIRPRDMPDQESIDDNLERLIAEAGERGVRAESRCVRSLGIGPSICETARETGADAIVMATNGYKGMRRFILGSNTEEVLRITDRPLFVIPDSQEPVETAFKRMLIPVDLSGSTRDQLRSALVLARSAGSQVVLLYVIEPMPVPRLLTGFGTLGDLAPSIDAQIEREMERLARRTSGELGREVGHVLRRGHAAREIIDAAEEMRADLIVMSRHGLSRIERFLLGSVTERVTRASSRPVLIVSDDPSSDS